MSEALKEKLRKGFDKGWNKGNLEAMFALYASSFVHYRSPLPPIESREAEKQDIENTLKAFSDIRFTIHEIIVEGDTAVMRWTWHGTTTGENSDRMTPADGKRVSMEGCSILHMHEGEIFEELEYADYLGYFTQLGVIPPID
ncbi:MAG TPA: ester cyclase [Anaerolineales bacterium]